MRQALLELAVIGLIDEIGIHAQPLIDRLMRGLERGGETPRQYRLRFIGVEGAAEQLRGFFGIECGQQGRQDLSVPQLLRGEVDAQVLVIERRGVWMALKQVALVVEQFEKTPTGPPVHQRQGQHLYTGGGRIKRGLMLHLPDQVANPLVQLEPQRTIAQPLRQRQVLPGQLLQAR